MSSFVLEFFVFCDGVVAPDVFPDVMTSPRRLHVATFTEPTFQVSRPASNQSQRLRPRQLPILAGTIAKALNHFVILVLFPCVIKSEYLINTFLAFLLNIDLIPPILFDLLFIGENLFLKISSLGIDVGESGLIAIGTATRKLGQRQI